MGLNYSPKIITNGLVLCLDAGNPKSYSGSGSTWKDLSGKSRNYSIDLNHATWDNKGFFTVTSKNESVFVGPASNSFGFSSQNEHTIIALATYSSKSNSIFFNWQGTPSVGTDTRAIQTHFPWNSDTFFYYDVSGCCLGTQRIFSVSAANNFENNLRMATWRTRVNALPNRQFFENLTSKVDSGNNSTATVTWDLTSPSGLCRSWNGKIYLIYVYNRALTDKEIQQNYLALRSRFKV
jgi:hypothetical protein